jgi:hypothetical protein
MYGFYSRVYEFTKGDMKVRQSRSSACNGNPGTGMFFDILPVAFGQLLYRSLRKQGLETPDYIAGYRLPMG